MYRFLFFIILCEFNFALKAYRNSTPNLHVDDYLVQEINVTDNFMDYYVPQTRTTRARTTQERTTQERTTQERTKQARTTQERTTQARTTQAIITRTSTTQASTTQASTTQASTTQASTTQASTTQASTTQASTTLASTLWENNEISSPEPTITTSPTTPRFKPIDYLVTMSPEQIYDVYSDLQALNKTIVEQTKFMYGEDRPDKYKYVQILLWGYFKSIVERYLTPENTTYADNTPPIGDYFQDNTETYPSRTTKIYYRSTTKYFRQPTYKDGNKTFYVGSTLKPVTRRTPSPLTTLSEQNQLRQSELNKLPGRQGPLYSTSTYNQQQRPYRTNVDRQPTQYPPIKLPVNKYYPSTPGRQDKYIKMSFGKLTQTERIGVNVIRQGIETSIDPAYYDLDATTGYHHVYTRPDSLIYGITEPSPPSSDLPIVKDAKTIMGTRTEGYFTAFMQELCTILAAKDPHQSKELYVALDQVMATMMSREGLFVDLGIKFETVVSSMIRKLIALEPDLIQSYASIAISALEEKEVALAEDLQTLLKDLDYIYSIQEGEELLNTLAGVEQYPKNDSAYVVVENVVKKVFRPYLRLAGSQTRQFLIQSINRVISIRGIDGRRHIDLKDRMFEKVYAKKKTVNSGFDEENISVDDKKCKMTTSPTKLNGMERNDVIVKELIENVKIMEAIKKYKTKIVQTTAKSWPNIYKRANFDEIQPKNNVKSKNIKKKSTDINFINKKDKMAILDDGVTNYKLKTKQNAKIRNNKETRKILYSEMSSETDRLSGSTSESESVSKTRRNKLDKYMKHKIRNHLIRNHANLNKILKKSQRNEKRQIIIKNKVLRKNEGQNRFYEVKNHRKEPSFKDKTRARDDERPSYNMRHSHEENRRLSGKRRHDGGKSRPPGANRRLSDGFTRNPAANQQPSMYLTPRYEYNSKRFNENLNLTRRSNAKPISTELSYSCEENDIKFNLQDAIRHPIDLKSKIQQRSLRFDKVQNGRRQMAPVDRLSLRDESNYSDDEGTIKSNIYKVFNKNN